MKKVKKEYKERIKVYPCNEDYFKTINTPEKAYWLGFIAADGCVCRTEGRYRTRIGLSKKDENHIEKFKKAIRSNHKLYFYKKESVHLCIYSRRMFFDLNNKGIVPRKSLILEYPDNLSKELNRHFIRGYFDGDGCISLNKKREYSIYFCSGSFEFLRRLSCILLEEAKIKTKCKINKNRDRVPFFVFSSSKDMKKIFDYMYGDVDSDIYLERKFKRFLECVKKCNRYLEKRENLLNKIVDLYFDKERSTLMIGYMLGKQKATISRILKNNGFKLRTALEGRSLYLRKEIRYDNIKVKLDTDYEE